MKSNALIVFIKTPVQGLVKTRLQEHIDPVRTVSLYTAFLQDLHERFKNRKQFDCWYSVAPEHHDPVKLNKIIPTDKIFLQSGIDLGQRMSNAFDYLFKSGYKNVILIGSDIPHISVEIINESFELLQDRKYSLVIGPAMDGGYFLMGMVQLHKLLFSGIPWSTESVFIQTLEKARKERLKVHLLKALGDIDDYSSLKYLYADLLKRDIKGADFPSNTWRELQNIFNSQ